MPFMHLAEGYLPDLDQASDSESEWTEAEGNN